MVEQQWSRSSAGRAFWDEICVNARRACCLARVGLPHPAPAQSYCQPVSRRPRVGCCRLPPSTAGAGRVSLDKRMRCWCPLRAASGWRRLPHPVTGSTYGREGEPASGEIPAFWRRPSSCPRIRMDRRNRRPGQLDCLSSRRLSTWCGDDGQAGCRQLRHAADRIDLRAGSISQARLHLQLDDAAAAFVTGCELSSSADVEITLTGLFCWINSRDAVVAVQVSTGRDTVAAAGNLWRTCRW